MKFPFPFRLDWFSYFIGFISGILAVGLISLLRIFVPKLREKIKQRTLAVKQELAKTTDERLRKDVLRTAERLHIASSLFTLDEILIPPRLLAPPPVIVPNSGLLEDDPLGIPLPYTPDWPELGVNYHAPTLSLPQALSRGAKLALYGNPGSGKTVSLAYLAMLIARQDPDAGDLKDKLPLLVHSSDLLNYLPQSENSPQSKPIEVMIEVVSKYASILTLPRLPGFLRLSFESGSVILLLDGLDELPPEQANLVTEYLGSLLADYPVTRVVAAASPDALSCLMNLGLVPVALASWEEHQRAEFVKNWGDLWINFIAPGIQEGPGEIDPLLLTAWLSQDDPFMTPLETTLKVWAAFAGDALGNRTEDSIEAYIRRGITSIPEGAYLLERLAAQMILTMNPSVTMKELESWVPELSKKIPQELPAASQPAEELPDKNPDIIEDEVSSDQEKVPENLANRAANSTESPVKGPVLKVTAVQNLVTELVANGILVARPGEKITFLHPIIHGYVAAKTLVNEEDLSCLGSQPGWLMKKVTLQFLAASMEMDSFITPSGNEKDDPLHRSLFEASRWLRFAPQSARWRSACMRQLAGITQNEGLPVGMRARAVAALISSGDTGVTALFKQLLASRSENVRWLAVLGCGLLREPKVINDLIRLTNDSSPKVGQAAVLALAAYGTRSAVETLTAILLEGSEEMRRTAAQAFAYLPEEGHPILREGSSVDDLLVRRAVAFGLSRVDEPWAHELLEKLQMEDNQWVVRSAATQALEELKRIEHHIPQVLPSLSETPWLIEFAAKQGVGVLPGEPAINLLLQALKSDDIYEQVAAIAYLGRMPEIDASSDLFDLMINGYGEIREEAYNALWHLGFSQN